MRQYSNGKTLVSKLDISVAISDEKGWAFASYFSIERYL